MAHCKLRGRLISDSSCRACNKKKRCDELHTYARSHYNNDSWLESILMISLTSPVSIDSCDCSSSSSNSSSDCGGGCNCGGGCD